MAARLILLVLTASVAACNPPGGSGTDSSNYVPDAGSPAAEGEILALACKACHTLNQGGPPLLGPNLYGIFWRAAAGNPDYTLYSDALKTSGIIWSPLELDAWLANPTGYLPGTTMGFSGYQSPDDRAALIEYLQAATSDRAGSPSSNVSGSFTD